MSEYLDPIIVTGVPRSRTSLVMQILEISGLFLGRVIQETRANPMKQLENTEVINKVVKSELKKYGYDPKAQYPVPDENFYAHDPERQKKILSILQSQGLQKNQKWGIKLCKAVWNHKGWNEAFPNATWIIVRRNDEDIIKSCLSPKAAFMNAYKTKEGWQEWINKHKTRFDMIKKNCNHVYELDTDAVINGDFSQLESIIKDLGLEWKPDRIKAQIQP